MEPPGIPGRFNLPPGIPIEGDLHIAANDSSLVECDISFLEHNPFHFYDVVFEADIEGNPPSYVELSSLLARSYVDDPTATPEVVPLPSARAFQVSAISPNPSSHGAVLQFSVPGPGRLSAEVFDAGGRLVRRLPEEFVTAGEKTLSWDGRSTANTRVASGVYYVRGRFDRQDGGTERLATRLVVLR